ncbi:MAG: mechanosensitive ion channel [Desulfovibrio sp.]|jgi:small-conductance mechanosensitive channel|nr:mechanosensitive ion channel [Desulfovibrio sp.]
MTLPQWSALLHEAELWFRTSILTWNTALQVGAVLLCAGLGLLLGRSARRAYRRRFAEQLESDVFFGKLFRAVDRVLWLSVAGVLLTVAGVAFRSMAEPARLLDVATTLTLAWIAIRLASGLILNRFWGHAASVSVWILVALDVVGLLDPLLTFMNDLGMNFGDARVTLLQAVKAVLLFVLLYQLAAALSRFSDDRLQRNMQLTPSAQVLFGKGVKFSLFTLAFVLALSSAGVNLTSLAVLSGAIGVGVGFGLQKIFANLVSGIILLFEKSIKPGDTVEMGGVYGVVRSLNARFTSVLTRDGKEYLIPNENLITNEVVIWTHTDPNVRLKIPVGISYDADPRLALRLMEEAARKVPRVLRDPAPAGRLTGFGDNSVDLEVRIWIRDAEQGVVNVQSEVLLNIWDAFKAHSIEIPFPQRDLHLRSLPPQWDRRKKKRESNN